MSENNKIKCLEIQGNELWWSEVKITTQIEIAQLKQYAPEYRSHLVGLTQDNFL